MKINTKLKTTINIILLIWCLIVIGFYYKEHSVYLLFLEIRTTGLLEILYTFYMCIISYFSGLTLLHYLKIKKTDVEKPVLFITSVTCGFGIISTLTFFLGLFHLYSMGGILIMHLIILAASSMEIKRTLDASANLQINFPRKYSANLFSTSLVFLLAAMIIMRFIYSLSPPYGDDGQWYHLGIPLDYLAKEKFYPILVKPAGAFPQAFEMISLNCLAVSTDISVSFFNFITGLLLLASVYYLIKKFVNPDYALILSIVFYSDPTIQFLNTEIKNDQFMTLAIVLSLYYFLLFWGSKNDKYLKPVGLFWGLALATKYTSLNILLFFISAVFFIILREKKENGKKLIATLMLLSITFSGVWYVKNIIVYKSPIAPFYNNIFFWVKPQAPKPAIAAASDPAQSTNISGAPQKRPYVDLVSFYGMGKKPADYLKLPWNVTIYGQRGTSRFDSTANPVYLALFPLFILAFYDKRVRFLLFIFCCQFFAWALQESQNSRYLIISLPFILMIIGYGISNIETQKIRQVILIVLGLSSFFFVFTEFIFFVHNDARPYLYVFRLETKDDYLKRVTGPLYEGASYLKNEWNNNKNIRAYFVGTRSNYFFREASSGDYNIRRVSEIVNFGKNPEGMKEYLKQHKINRILIEYKMLNYFYTRSDERKEELRKFIEFRNKYLREVFAKKGLNQIVGVYELLDTPRNPDESPEKK